MRIDSGFGSGICGSVVGGGGVPGRGPVAGTCVVASGGTGPNPVGSSGRSALIGTQLRDVQSTRHYVARRPVGASDTLSDPSGRSRFADPQHLRCGSANASVERGLVQFFTVSLSVG